MKATTITKYFKVCKTCKGTGSEWVDSHDCWGQDDSYKVSCYSCGGEGFTIDSNVRKKIKTQLGIS